MPELRAHQLSTFIGGAVIGLYIWFMLAQGRVWVLFLLWIAAAPVLFPFLTTTD